MPGSLTLMLSRALSRPTASTKVTSDSGVARILRPSNMRSRADGLSMSMSSMKTSTRPGAACLRSCVRFTKPCRTRSMGFRSPRWIPVPAVSGMSSPKCMRLTWPTMSRARSRALWSSVWWAMVATRPARMLPCFW